MKRISIIVPVIALALVASLAACGISSSPNSLVGPVIETGDVDRFFKVYDDAHDRPTAEALQHDYIDTPEKPADIGYWAGYRVVKAYYQQADDKCQAIRDIFQMTNPREFLARSGWGPRNQARPGSRWNDVLLLRPTF